MKSAYELAMERLDKTEPAAVPLSGAQKNRLAEIDKVYAGKIAEREIFLKQRLADEMAKNDYAEILKVEKEIVAERARLEEDRESEKERVRREK